jgi:hypothetical protein
MPSIQDKIDALEEDNFPVIYGLWTSMSLPGPVSSTAVLTLFHSIELPACYRDQPAAEESLLESLEQSYSPEKCQ